MHDIPACLLDHGLTATVWLVRVNHMNQRKPVGKVDASGSVIPRHFDGRDGGDLGYNIEHSVSIDTLFLAVYRCIVERQPGILVYRNKTLYRNLYCYFTLLLFQPLKTLVYSCYIVK